MPPKPVSQGPRKRTDARQTPNRNVIVLAGAGALAVVIAVVLVLVLSGGDSGPASGTDASVRAALTGAGCKLQIVKALAGADHSVEAGGRSDKWNTDPPTSGPHFPETALYGAYDGEVEQARLLHNLEHGAVYIQYGDKVPAATVDELKGFYETHQSGTILAPLKRLGKQIALGAWNAPNPSDEGQGILAKCTTFDEAAYSAFFKEYQYKGPERFSPDSMAPGNP